MPRPSFLLERFSIEDMKACSDALRAMRSRTGALDDVAAQIVSFLHDSLVDADGAPACALVRLYKTHAYGKLPADAQEFAANLLGAVPADDVRCLTLFGTAGSLPEWNDVAASKGHRAIPLPSVEMVRRLPMVSQLITQLGLDVGSVVAPPRDRAVVSLAHRTNDVFHVEEAVGSPYLPAQEEFIVPHGVRSAVGFGGILLTGDFYATILFSRVRIAQDVAKALKILALAIRVPLLPYALSAASSRSR